MEVREAETRSLCVTSSNDPTRLMPEQCPTVSPPLYSDIPGIVPLSHGIGNSPPPSYDEVVDPEAAPPSYHSLFGQVREARKNSSGVIDFVRKVIMLLLGTIGCTIILGVTVVIPLSMIIIGVNYIDQCRAEPYIPVYLVVGGVFGVIKNLMNFWSRCRRTSAETSDDRLHHKPHENILNCFLFTWFIAGCIWIYRVYEPEYANDSSPLFCNKTVYLFAFWLVTSTFIIIGIMSVCVMCFVVSSILTSID